MSPRGVNFPHLIEKAIEQGPLKIHRGQLIRIPLLLWQAVAVEWQWWRCALLIKRISAFTLEDGWCTGAALSQPPTKCSTGRLTDLRKGAAKGLSWRQGG